MRVFTTTKAVLLATLLAVNLTPAKRALAQGDPNCNKTCGELPQGGTATRSCTGGTCWITSCALHSNYCNGFSDNHNDFCSSSPMIYCYPN